MSNADKGAVGLIPALDLASLTVALTADMFAKNLGQAKFCKFRGQLGLEFY